MILEKTAIEGLIVIKPKIFSDERGYFYESENNEKYNILNIPNFVQENQSESKKNVLRGLHLQISPHEQGKLVRVVKGSVLDVAVDLRKKSKTYGKYFSIKLSSKNKKEMYIPPGFAHGFYTLSKTAIFLYMCTKKYNKESEVGIKWNDPDLNIDWGCEMPTLSDKDQKNISLKIFEKKYLK
ncbi:MAG: dTDP-4-dehydrorhamnose 3,5-epimerase [Nanoarchaeota archaeon]|nr:dTDP-4-dehydrorhamnose 3,5-epimerase [Nanoarchaeota archaeon]